MRKSSAFLFITLFVIATVCCPTKAVSQAGSFSETPQPKVTVGKLLLRVAPVYSPIAKAARIQGTVVLEAVIGKDGLLNSITVVSGPPLLQQAAIDAVKQWKYQPYLLGGEPVEVKTTLNIAFSLEDVPTENGSETANSKSPSNASSPTNPFAQAEATAQSPAVPTNASVRVATDVHGPFFFSCENGTKFSITFYNEANNYTASIKVNGEPAETLAAVPAATGSHYAGSHYTYDESHGESWLDDSLHGEKSISCHEDRNRKWEAANCRSVDPRSMDLKAVDSRCFAYLRELRAKQEAEAEMKEAEARKAVERALAASHTTRYRGLYIGEPAENAPIKQSGCSTDSWTVGNALDNIGTGKSRSECIVSVSTNDSRTIETILIFTRTSFIEEYRALVGQYGSPLPGRYKLVDGDVPDSIVWHTKDGTDVAEKADTLRERANPGRVIPYTLVEYLSR